MRLGSGPLIRAFGGNGGPCHTSLASTPRPASSSCAPYTMLAFRYDAAQQEGSWQNVAPLYEKYLVNLGIDSAREWNIKTRA